MSKVSKKTAIPKLRFPEFEKDQKWLEHTIGDITPNVSTGATPSTTEPKFWGGEIRWMNSGELNLKKVHEVEGRITQLGLKNSSTKILPKGCVLIGLAGQGKTRGTVAMNFVELCTNQSIAAIHPNETVFNSNFLYQNLEGRYDELRRISAGDGGRGGLNLQMIKNLNIYLPKNPGEQKKVADCLSSLDDLISAQNEKIYALRNLKTGLLQQLFPQDGETIPRLRFPEFKNSGDWVTTTTLGEIATYENGKAHEKDISENGKYIVANSKFISTDGEIKKFTNTPFCLANKNEILMVLSDVPNGRAIAKCYYVEKDNDITVNQRICKIAALKVDSRFLFYTLNRNPYFLKFDDGVKQTNLSKDDVLNCPVALPENQKEQEKISTLLMTIDDRINSESAKSESLKNHKMGLLQQLFPKLENTDNE